MNASVKPAQNTVRGFQTPPLVEGDYSGYVNGSPHRKHVINDVVSANSSPILRPTRHTGLGGISKLKLQLEEIDSLKDKRSCSSVRHKKHFLGHPITSSSGGTASVSPEIGLSDDEAFDTCSCDTDVANNSYLKSLNQNTDRSTLEDSTNYNPSRPMSASDFKALRCLGKGTFGIVHLVKQQSTGRLYAQKQFKKASLTTHERLIRQTKNERSILESVNRHPFVVKLFYAFQDEEKLYLILEYAQGGELFTHLSQVRMFSEPVAAFYMAEMVLALDHLHQHLGVVYRDLKPENCLLDSEGHLLLTDFGLSKVAPNDNDKFNSVLGTVEYMAPEIVMGHEYGKAVDWWSFGALGFDLLTGSPPFKGQNHRKIQERIIKQKLQMPYYLSPDAKDLITRLLRKEPSKRLGSNMPKDMQTIKKHRFFRRIDWKLLAKRGVEPPIQPTITDPELAENFASEFTNLPISPLSSRNNEHNKKPLPQQNNIDENPFGGFSFVASASLLEGTFGGGQYADLGNEVEV